MDAKLRQALCDGEKLGRRYALQLPQVAARGVVGPRLGRRVGASIDFQDYREYQPGDDLRSLDWGIYARTDRLAVKLYREEVLPHLDLVLDGSRSMDLENTAKGSALAQLAAVLASAAANARCTQAVWFSGAGFQRVANDRAMASAWDGLELTSTRTPEESFEILPPQLRRLGMRVLVSDLLWPGNPGQTLRRLREGAAAVFIIQLLGRDDVTLPEHGNLRVVDSETGEETEIYVDAGVAREYSENLARWQQAWSDACRQHGAQMTTVVAEELESQLVELEAMQLIEPA